MKLNFTIITSNYLFIILLSSSFFIFTVYFLDIQITIILTTLFGFATLLFLYIISKANKFLSYKSIFFLVASLILLPFVMFLETILSRRNFLILTFLVSRSSIFYLFFLFLLLYFLFQAAIGHIHYFYLIFFFFNFTSLILNTLPLIS